MSKPAPEECAVCGAAVPRRAQACPECGADDRTGWRGQSVYDGLDLPEESWRDDDAPEAQRAPVRVNGLPWYWWLVGVLLLGLVLAGFVGWR